MPRDSYGYPLTASDEAAAAYNAGVLDVLRLRAGALDSLQRAVVLDPTFAVGHAAIALLGHEMVAPVDVAAHIRQARQHARRATARERSHVRAVVSHVAGDSRPLIKHLEEHPRDALLLNSAVPTIAFAGAVEAQEEAWAIVERAIPAYGDDWFFTGLLAFMRQEQRRFDDAMELSLKSLAVEPGAGHSAHARAHAHYETGDHEAGLSWMDSWVVGDGKDIESLSHFSWHAAMHELSLGDLDAVRQRYETQLLPENLLGCRGLIDTGSLLYRWALTPNTTDVPDIRRVTDHAGRDVLENPPSPFVAMHSAVMLLATDDVAGLRSLADWAARHSNKTQREVVAPLASTLALMASGQPGAAADRLGQLAPQIVRLGGSDAQREIIEETRIAALLRADRWDDARMLIDERLDRRHAHRDVVWRDAALTQAGVAPTR